MQAIIQKYLQSALFYLLIATLIMMGGIIVGYLWSGDIGLWIYDSGASISTTFTVIGSVFTVLTFGLGIIAYNHWKHPFDINKLHMTINLGQDLLEMLELANNYSESLTILVASKIGHNQVQRGIFRAAAIKYESKVIEINIYNHILRNLSLNISKPFSPSDLSFGRLTEEIAKDETIDYVKSTDGELKRLHDIMLLKVELLQHISDTVYREIDRLANKLPS
ncbi:hypothetical protein HG547_16040 [Shewanella sp. DNRA4]|uniref:hypothetical protein n=1 Tax=unclassified Shewanella TaxID=196818 RepID=UPI00146B14D1|nr:hypothetical protein [Shewanella sp. DNRA4]NMD53117.1 hypothetical protein [Shewanella sp. DNRA4]